jgi:hypothetical protein
MSRRLFVALLGLGLALFLMPQVSLAAEEDHIAEAIAHTKQAILHGQKVHADLLGEHAKTAPTQGLLRSPTLIPTMKRRSKNSNKQSMIQ